MDTGKRIPLPVIAMNGAVLYDTKNHSYIKAYVISSETAQKVVSIIKEESVNYYSNVIIDDMLVIYYQKTDDEAVVYFMLLDRKDRIANIYNRFMAEGFDTQLRIITYDSTDYPGYSYIKIYNKNATKENMIKYLKDFTGISEAVTFGSIKDQYDVYIDTEDVNKVVREVRKRYEPLFK